MTDNFAIKIENISKKYKIYDSPKDRLKQMFFRGRKFFTEFEALKPVSFTINKGETVGIIGTNGSGKSTLLQIICSILTPSNGNMQVNGRISALLELGAGFNPDFSGRENVILNASILGLSEAEILAKYDDIVAFSGLDIVTLNHAVSTYSSGMYVRLAFAVAVAVEPDILIVDEALAVGDEAFQRKCFSRIKSLQERGATILFVSHSSGTITNICTRCILLDDGEQLLDTSPKEAVAKYHKLIYASPAKRAEVREEIKNNVRHIIQKTIQDDDFFHENMKPESTVEYPSNGAIISNPHLEDIKGNYANILQRQNIYIYKYMVKFTEDATKVRFGMAIKTKTGIEIGSACSFTEDEYIDVSAGDKIEISFKFKAMILPETYFLNCGCSGIINDERIFLHRIVDAYMFKILPEMNIKEQGIVDFMVESLVEKM